MLEAPKAVTNASADDGRSITATRAESALPHRSRSAAARPKEPFSSEIEPGAASWVTAGALLILIAEAAYLLKGLLALRVTPLWLALHIFNLIPGITLLCVASTRWFRRNWQFLTWAMCAALIAGTTAISLITGQTEPRFGTILLSLLGTAALAPWSFRRQASLELVGIGCFAAGNSFGFYHWLTLILAMLLGHAAMELNRRGRERLAEEIQQSRKGEARLKEKLAELEQSEQRARANAETVQKIIDASPDTVSINRYADGTYVQLLDPKFDGTGYAAEEVIGKNSYKLGRWADRAEYKQYLAQLNERGRVRNMEVTFRRKDGTLVPTLLSSTIVNLHGEQCVVSFSHEVTRLKEAERQIRESEIVLRKIIEASPDIITINRLSDGRFIAVNNAFVEITGFSREEALKTSAQELGMWGDEQQLNKCLRLLREDGIAQSVEVELRGRDGRARPYLFSAVVVELAGEPSIVAIGRDITELKETENQLKAARAAALEAARAKSEFLSNMSHEIRTPMNAILGTAELLWQTPLSEDQRRYLDIMRASGDALIDLINDILDLAKIESGRLTIEACDFDLEELIDKLGETMAIRSHEKGVELVTRIAPDVPLKLRGDVLRLRQILVNLAGNAIKFTERGEVMLEVERSGARNSSTRWPRRWAGWRANRPRGAAPPWHRPARGLQRCASWPPTIRRSTGCSSASSSRIRRSNSMKPSTASPRSSVSRAQITTSC
jgi:PAS domain S-box-containing protein